jgi:hypothetical protein
MPHAQPTLPWLSQERKCHCEPQLFRGVAIALHDRRLLHPAEERQVRNDMHNYRISMLKDWKQLFDISAFCETFNLKTR